MDLAVHQRLVTLTGGALARAWISAFRHVREQPAQHPMALAERIPGLDAALGAYAAAQHVAYVTAGHATTRWLTAALAPRVQKKLLNFDPADPEVLTWAERNRLNLVTGVGMEQRSLIRAALIAMQEDGRNPKDVARELYDSLGLTPAQEAVVQNYRRQLEGQQYGAALERELSHGSSDRAIAATARADRALTKEQIDRAVSRYRENFQRLRADTILRTEGARVANQAQDEAYRQAISRGDLAAEQLEQGWVATHDPRTRDSHAAMHGQTRQWGEPFESGAGVLLRFPCDPEAPPKETINCRCARTVRILPPARAANAA